ncbi:MAG TPA: Lrp/AsnC family transcriptional regulator [Streptosporangiaceae bacterium]
MESATLDDTDRKIIHALQIDGRAPFRTVADAVGVSEQTVARRYRRMRDAGALRVVGAVIGPRLGYVSWTIRLRCTPDAAVEIGAALARRDDTFWVHLLSGGTEISCNTQTRSDADRDSLLLEKLPRTRRVLGVTAHAVLRGYVWPNNWGALRRLAAPRAARLRPETDPVPPDAAPVPLADGDRTLLDALARDGRATHDDLAAATGWSPSTVRRRLRDLRRTGVLTYQLDVSSAAVGRPVVARLWMSVRPSAVDSVGAALAGHDEVSFAASTTGTTNLLAVVHCRGPADLHRYLGERVAVLDGVRAVETAPVLRTLKGAGTR